MLADLFPTIVLVLVLALAVLAKAPKAADPELEFAEAKHARAADRSAARRDLHAVHRKRGAGRKVAAGTWATTKAGGRVARRRFMATATVIAVAALMVMLTDPVTSWMVGAGAIVTGLLAGRTISARRVTKAPLDPIPPTVTPLRVAVQVWVGVVCGSPRKHAVGGVLAVVLPMMAYVGGSLAGMVAAASTVITVGLVARWAHRPIRQRLVDQQHRQRAEAALDEQVAAAAGCKPYEVQRHATSTPDRLVYLLEKPSSYEHLLKDADAPLVNAGLPQWEGEVSRTENVTTGGSDRWFILTPVTPATERRRALIAASAGLVTAVTDQDVRGNRRLTLAEGISPARAGQVAAWAKRELDADLVEWDPHNSGAVVAKLSPKVREVRARLSDLMRVEPHRLDVEIDEGPDHIGEIRIRKAPSLTTDPVKRRDGWQELILSIPDGTNGWKVCEDSARGDLTLTWGAPRALPRTVSLADLLPAGPDPSGWASLPLGLGEDGRPRGLDLTLGPHSLLVGPTGSGKTVGILALAAQQLARGFDVAIIDPTKSGVDFASIEPYTRGFARTYAEAAALIKAVYAEGQRRKPLLLQHGAVKWDELPAAVRDAEGVRPVALIIDELASLLSEAVIPKGLPKDDPDVLEAQELNGHKAILSLYVGKIARELRFVGIHLLLAMQRPDASYFGGGEGRSNLTSTVQLAKPGSPPSLDAIRMLFTGDSAQEAYEVLRALDDGRSRGLGVVAGDGGGVDGVRVAYAPMRDIPALLAEGGVHPRGGVPFITAAESPVSAPRPGQRVTGRRIEEPVFEHLDEDDAIVVDIEPRIIGDLSSLFGDPEPATAGSTRSPWGAAAAARKELITASTPQAQPVLGVDDLFGPPIRRTHVDEGFDTPRAAVPVEDQF